MKMKCISNSIFRGDTVRRGQIVDVTEAEAKTGMVKANFVAVEAEHSSVIATAPQHGAVATTTPQRAVVAGLTREQALTKLRKAGANIKGNATNVAIAEAYNHTFANVAEATETAD